jgi:hypothetical protein
MRLFGALLTASLLIPAVVWAKDFGPGDLRVCGAARCRVIEDGTASSRFGRFLYGNERVVPVPTPRVGSPVFQLRFKDGPAGVILNRTAARVHGLNCGRFNVAIGTACRGSSRAWGEG